LSSRSSDMGTVPRTYRAIQAFVAAGLGVAMLPRLALTLIPPRLVRVGIRQRPPVRRISAARLAKSFRSPATETMVRVLAETAAAPDRLP
jgi:DNA-binding transcriptional LysR family regulator